MSSMRCQCPGAGASGALRLPRHARATSKAEARRGRTRATEREGFERVHGSPRRRHGRRGFIGGHLAERLVREGARVRAFVRCNSRGDRGTLDWLEPDVAGELEVVHGDVRDVESVAAALEGANVVFHLAAQIAIPYSYVNPRGYFETNVLGTLNVAQAARAAAVERVVEAS